MEIRVSFLAECFPVKLSILRSVNKCMLGGGGGGGVLREFLCGEGVYKGLLGVLKFQLSVKLLLNCKLPV